MGQFKIPFSWKASGSAPKLLFQSALWSPANTATVATLVQDRKKFDHFSYLLGVYNGEGQNNLDTNEQKDVALRLEVYPIKELTIAAVGYVSVGDRELVGTKDRIEGDIKFEKSGFLLQAEAIRGWDMVSAPAGSPARRIKGQGFYVAAGYTLFDKLQPIVRVGSIDPEIGADEHGSKDIPAVAPLDEMTAYEFGLNYYLKQHDTKLQLAASFFDPEQKAAHTTFDMILAAQVAF